MHNGVTRVASLGPWLAYETYCDVGADGASGGDLHDGPSLLVEPGGSHRASKKTRRKDHCDSMDCNEPSTDTSTDEKTTPHIFSLGGREESFQSSDAVLDFY